MSNVVANVPTNAPKTRKKISNTLRNKILQRDNFTCQSPDCKSDYVPPERLHIHHHNHDPNDNRMSNLITCCAWCNNRAKSHHYAQQRRLHRLYKSLTKYKTRQTSFHFD